MPTILEVSAEYERHAEDLSVSNPLANTSIVAYDGVTVTPLFVERLLFYLDVLRRQRDNHGVTVPLSDEENCPLAGICKYFKNLRSKKKARNFPIPSEAECLGSPLGLAYGLVWNTLDPSTVWPSLQARDDLLSASSLVVAAPESHASTPSDRLHILAEAASVDSGFRNNNMGNEGGRSLAAIIHEIQSHQVDFETCANRASLAHRDYLEKHAAAIIQWNLAHDVGFLAHDALRTSMILTEELTQRQVRYFELLQEFEEYSSQMRQRRRDDF
jgi:hypothetical protein